MKRQYTQQQPRAGDTRRPSVPDDVGVNLLQVGRRARKHVSEGHMTQSARQYSFERQVDYAGEPPKMSTEWLDMRPKSKFEKPIPRPNLKRRFDDDEEEDEGTDVDEPMDEEKPRSMTELKAYYVPANFRSQSEAQDDFEEAPFLRQGPQ